MAREYRSQPERDWAYAKRALALATIRKSLLDATSPSFGAVQACFLYDS